MIADNGNGLVLVGDVNGDGKADLVAVGVAGQTDAGVVYVALGDGNGFSNGWTWTSKSRMIADNGNGLVLMAVSRLCK
jgi:hypothetical protein